MIALVEGVEKKQLEVLRPMGTLQTKGKLHLLW
jgi:hypothetical protein